MSAGYRVAPIFVIRLAGLPFDVLQQFGTPSTSAAARALLVRQDEFAKAKSDVEHLLRSRGHGLSEPAFRAWRKAVRSGSTPPETDLPLKQLAEYKASAANLAAEESKLTELLPRKLEEARATLLQSACAILPPYLVFANEGIRESLNKLSTDNPRKNHLLPPPRNKQTRLRERHLLLYLQRICSKNDTFSEFGPSVWGSVEAKMSGIDLVFNRVLSNAKFIWSAGQPM